MTIKLSLLQTILNEENFDIKRRKVGEVQFPTSALNDSYIQDTIKLLSQHTGRPVAEIVQYVKGKIKELQDMTSKSPLLYDTINKNAVEQTVFTEFWKLGLRVQGAPKFSNVIFNKLIRKLRVEYDEFFPLRSYIDKRHLATPRIVILEPDDPEAKELQTAAASPSGVFYFNRNFMQSLMDYAYLKQIKPKGKKYEANGGPFPNEYAWIEFVIMHEFMHYSNDDFYYQKVIPNANPTIINWVGDFRTNYLLTKSGFEALPMGLFNDAINYDRQNEYIDMYNIVRDEFAKLNKDQQEKLKKKMGELSDNHEKGNGEGEKSDVSSEDATPGELDDHAKDSGDAIDDAKRNDDADPSSERGKDGGQGNGKGQGGPGKGGRNPRSHDVNYANVKPKFNWKTLVDRFIKSGMSRTEETYAKPARRSITTMDTARQTGAAAIKPAQRPADLSDAKLMFILDNSGSMSSTLATVIANAKKLLEQPAFRKATILALKFSDDAELYKVNVGGNKAGQIQEPKENPKNWSHTADQVLASSFSSGTTVSDKMVTQTANCFAAGYNVIMFTDGDVTWGSNLTNTVKMIKSGPQQMYIVFDSRDTWIKFRQKTGITTANITYFE